MPHGPIRESKFNIDEQKAKKAIRTVVEILRFLSFYHPIIKRHPRDELTVLLPLMYNGYALDRIYFDPDKKRFLPKGKAHIPFYADLNLKDVKETAESLLREIRVIDAVEIRLPEKAWAVPIAWRSYIVAHIKVDEEGSNVIPDYPLTEEIRRHVI